MTSTKRKDESDAESAGYDRTADDLLRAVAHAPERIPPMNPARGALWGERGRYVIERRLGHGGMGTVYLATDSLLGRKVALKVLDRGESPEEDAQRRRLMREARLGAGIEHDRVARVYDVSEHDGSMFVAMEYVRGVTLRAWMSEVHAPAEVLAILTQVAEGLRVLHESGVVHRDLKPENVMLPLQGGVKLLDFGLAGHVSHGDPAAAVTSGPHAVAPSSSAFRGTPGYMAPEQYRGDRVDARADIFALGILVVELVTGERPFRGATMPALSLAIEKAPRLDAPAWRGFPAGLPPIVARMLLSEREARYANGAAAWEALRELAEPRPSLPPSGRRPRSALRARAPWIVAGTLVLLGSSGWALFGPRRARERAHRAALANAPHGMILVDEGTLTVGRNADVVNGECAALGDKCNPALMGWQVPAIEVTVPPFFLDAREVTNDEFAFVLNTLKGTLYIEADEDTRAPRFVRFNKTLGKFDGPLLDLDPKLGGIEHAGDSYRALPGRGSWPVTQVSWYGANSFCSTQGKRLPTENEWEAAARGHEDRPFPWGSELPGCGRVVIPSDGFLPLALKCPDTPSPIDVGTAPGDVTPLGVHDLGGNVAEWVDTAYVEGTRASTAPPGATDLPRVIRGGSYFFSLMARTSVRNKRPSATAAFNVGFRCAVDVTTSELDHEKK